MVEGLWSGMTEVISVHCTRPFQTPPSFWQEISGHCFTISSENTIDIHKLQREIIPKELYLKRQWYLYEEISPFCSSSETASITCTHPTQPKPISTTNSDLLSDPMAGGPTEERVGVKRKPTCSHCHQEGHTKTKKVKIICDRIWENPPYAICTRFAWCALLVAQVQICQ